MFKSAKAAIGSTKPAHFIYRALMGLRSPPVTRLIDSREPLVGMLRQPVDSIFFLPGNVLPLNHQPAESAAYI